MTIDSPLSRAEIAFAEQVKLEREKRGWSQGRLADDLRKMEGLEYVRQTTVSRIEAATRPVRMIEAQGFARVFEKPVASLMSPDGDMERAEMLRWMLEQGTNDLATAKRLIKETRNRQLWSESAAQQLRLDAQDTESPEMQQWYTHRAGLLEFFSERDIVAEVAEIVKSVSRDG